LRNPRLYEFLAIQSRSKFSILSKVAKFQGSLDLLREMNPKLAFQFVQLTLKLLLDYLRQILVPPNFFRDCGGLPQTPKCTNRGPARVIECVSYHWFLSDVHFVLALPKETPNPPWFPGHSMAVS